MLRNSSFAQLCPEVLMDKKSMIFFVIMMVAMMLFMQHLNTQKQAPVQIVTLKDAQSMELKAGNDKAALKKVLDKYNEVAKANAGTEIEAQANYERAFIEETKLKDEGSAVKDYKSLVDSVPLATSPTARLAQKRLDDLERNIDVEKSSGIGYKAIDSLVALTGRNPNYSFALALLIITIIVKLVTTPLSKKQYQSMKEMQKIAPLVKDIQEKFKGDQKAIGEKTMALYKEHGVNPFASCLPLLIQMPILIGLYWGVIQAYVYQFTKGRFLWIGSHWSTTLPAFYTVPKSIPLVAGHKIPLIASNLSMPDMPLLLLYTASMVVSQKLTVVDPSQAEQQKMMAWMMPLMFGVLFMTFPSALMLYWLMFNVFSTAQQYLIMKPQMAAAGAPAAELPPPDKGPIPSKISKKKKS
jgi:YidC/Oxa1 family membrane protein insertase